MNERIENKQKFNFTEFFKNNRKIIIFIIVTSIILIMSLIAFNEYNKKENIEISKKYNKAKVLIENNNSQQALKILEEIVFENNTFYSPSALNLIVDNNLIEDKEKILSYFDQIISNTSLELEIKNLFIFKKTILIGDDIEESKLLSNLKPILNSNSLWKNTISDYIAKYYLSKGEFKKAKEFQVTNN